MSTGFPPAFGQAGAGRPPLSPPPAPAAAPAPDSIPLPPGARRFDDVTAIRRATNDVVLKELQRLPVLQDPRWTLSVANVGFDDPEEFGPEEESRARLDGKTLGRRIRGDFRWTNNATGETDVRRKTLARVPYLTPRGYIVNGNYVHLRNQPRLRPGVYARYKANGDLEARIQSLPGKGRASSIGLEPESGRFVWTIGQANIPLFPALKLLGKTREDMVKAWGEDQVRQNEEGRGGMDVLDRLYKAEGLVRSKREPDRKKAVLDAIHSIEMDPEVVEATLGTPHKNVSGDLLLQAATKLLRLSRGEEEEDDREDAAYSKIMGNEDLFGERIAGRAASAYRQEFQRVARATSGHLDKFGSDFFGRHLQEVLSRYGLQVAPTGVNPDESLALLTSYSRMGFGGVSSSESIPDELRSVKIGQYGVFDILQSPESELAGAVGSISGTAVHGKDGIPHVRLRNARTGKWEWVTPMQMRKVKIAFANSWDEEGPTVFARNGKRVDVVDRGNVDYIYPEMEETFSPITQAVAGKQFTKGQRAIMGLRMTTQAMPLKEPEAPLVRSGVPSSPGESYESKYGPAMGAVRADKAGVVTEVRPDRVVVRYEDGTKARLPLYQDHPLNRKSVVGSTRILIRRADGTSWRGPIADYAHRAGDRTLAVDPVTLRSVWMEVAAVVRHDHSAPTAIMRTAMGNACEMTPDHSLVTVGGPRARPRFLHLLWEYLKKERPEGDLPDVFPGWAQWPESCVGPEITEEEIDRSEDIVAIAWALDACVRMGGADSDLANRLARRYQQLYRNLDGGGRREIQALAHYLSSWSPMPHLEDSDEQEPGQGVGPQGGGEGNP